jgi:hypothetical protein
VSQGTPRIDSKHQQLKEEKDPPLQVPECAEPSRHLSCLDYERTHFHSFVVICMEALGHSGVQDKTFENIGFRCMMVQPGFDKIVSKRTFCGSV